MIRNEVIDSLLSHRSIRKYTDRVPDDEVIETIARAGQQAAFAMQLGSVLLSRGSVVRTCIVGSSGYYNR